MPLKVNATAKIESVEAGSVRMHLRGGRGNPVLETWCLSQSGPNDFHAARWGRNGDLIAYMSGFDNEIDALEWLSNAAWGTHKPDSLTTYPARVCRALRTRPVNPCPYTFAHTRSWCGYPLCREA